MDLVCNLHVLHVQFHGIHKSCLVWTRLFFSWKLKNRFCNSSAIRFSKCCEKANHILLIQRWQACCHSCMPPRFRDFNYDQVDTTIHVDETFSTLLDWHQDKTRHVQTRLHGLCYESHKVDESEILRNSTCVQKDDVRLDGLGLNWLWYTDFGGCCWKGCQNTLVRLQRNLHSDCILSLLIHQQQFYHKHTVMWKWMKEHLPMFQEQDMHERVHIIPRRDNWNFRA